MSIFGVFQVRIQSECGKIRTRKSPNTDTFHGVISILKYRDHLSIKLIWENVSLVNSLIIIESDIEKEILKLNLKKP